jgi:hypothetical protein
MLGKLEEGLRLAMHRNVIEGGLNSRSPLADSWSFSSVATRLTV